jgi:uncharacterized membrane protein YidH (DUF202 family)
MNHKWSRAAILVLLAALATGFGLNGVFRGIRDIASPLAASLGETELRSGLFVTGIAIFMWAAVAMAYADYKAEQAVRAPEEMQRESSRLRKTIVWMVAVTIFAAVFWLLP